MPETYSTYEAKSRFAEIIRRVREGHRIVISYRGEPVAEIMPIDRQPTPLSEALNGLVREGVLVGGDASAVSVRAWRPLARRPGSLRRFIASRDE